MFHGSRERGGKNGEQTEAAIGRRHRNANGAALKDSQKLSPLREAGHPSAAAAAAAAAATRPSATRPSGTAAAAAPRSSSWWCGPPRLWLSIEIGVGHDDVDGGGGVGHGVDDVDGFRAGRRAAGGGVVESSHILLLVSVSKKRGPFAATCCDEENVAGQASPFRP